MLSRTCQAVVKWWLLPHHEQEKSKKAKYAQKTEALRHLFRPVTMKVSGCWGQDAEDTLIEASLVASATLGITSGQFKSQWYCCLATCL